MSIIYASACDHLNLHPYDLYVPVYYEPQLPDVYRTGELAPLYTPIGGFNGKGHYQVYADAKVKARYAIKDMIDMYASRVPFEIIHDKDVVYVFHMLDNYMVEVQDQITLHDVAVTAYVKKVIALRVVLYQRFRRVLNLHPDWRDAYRGGTTKAKKIFDDINTIFGLNSTDPIEALRHPPYRIEDLTQPKNTQSQHPQNLDDNGIPLDFEHSQSGLGFGYA